MDWRKIGARFSRGASIAAGVALAIEDPLVRAQLLMRIKDGHVSPTVNAVLDEAVAGGRITPEQASRVRERLGLTSS